MYRFFVTRDKAGPDASKYQLFVGLEPPVFDPAKGVFMGKQSVEVKVESLGVFPTDVLPMVMLGPGDVGELRPEVINIASASTGAVIPVPERTNEPQE